MSGGGEFDLIRRHFARESRDGAVTLGVGDDAALVRVAPGMELVLAVDMMVEGRHFLPGADAEALGHKILAVNLSDIAAMGARPRFALLAGALPEADHRWLEAFARGLFALADAHGVSLVGGDTTRGPRNLCLTIAGEVPEGAAIRRSGARIGDDVWVSGTLGDAMLGLAAVEGRIDVPDADRATLRERLDRPVPRVALGEKLRGIASAMIDVSDGFVGDLGHVLQASGVGAEIKLDAIPRSPTLDAALRGGSHDAALACLVAGGDDYELCFTAAAAVRERLTSLSREIDVPLTRIGAIVGEPGLVVRDAEGRVLDLPRAFDHFV